MGPMNFLRHIPAGLRALIGRPRADDDLADEVAHFLREAEADLVARGSTPEEARRSVRLRYGDGLAAREDVRSYFWESAVESVASDLRLALRRLARDPGFTVVALLTLGIGVGAATAIYSAVRPVLLEPLPYPDADALVDLALRGQEGVTTPVAFGTHLEFVARNRSFSALAVSRPWQATLGGDGEPLLLAGRRVSASFLDVLGVAPARGRAFEPDEDRPGGPDVILLSDRLWRDRLGADPSILGSTLPIDGRPFTVVGIMPPDFVDVAAPAAQAWALLQYDPAPGTFDSREWGLHLTLTGRLRSGVDPDAARGSLAGLAANPDPAFPRPEWASLSNGVQVRGLREAATADVRPTMLVLAGAMGLLMLATCANLSILMIARGARRQGEFAMRVALGAGRRRLLRYVLTEGLLLALLGGGLGVVVAGLGLEVIMAANPEVLAERGGARLDPAALAFALGLSVGVGVLFSLLPGLPGVVGRPSPLGGSVRGSVRRSRSTRHSLVVAEVALAAALLVGAGLLVRSTQRVFAEPPGFDPGGALVMQVQGTSLERGDAAIHRFFDDATRAVASLPGVRAVTTTSQLPLSGDADVYGAAQDEADVAEGSRGNAFRYVVGPDYFDVMGIRILQGRALQTTDGEDAPRVVVLSRTLARTLFGDADPLGRGVRIGPPIGAPFTVVGVADDVKQTALSAAPAAGAYVTAPQWHWADRVRWFVVDAPGDPAEVFEAARRAVWSVDPGQPIVRSQAFPDMVAASEARRRLVLVVLSAFAAAAAALATVGLYGVLAGSVSERAHELGVRAALGASRGEVRALVLRQGLALTGAGLVAGLVGAALSSALLATLLFGVSRLDPVTYLAVAALLGGTAAVACWVPAWRAGRVDPRTALRAD